MNIFSHSPLLKTLLIVNAMLCIGLFLSSIWPLPEVESNRSVSTSDILADLWETEFVVDQSAAVDRPIFHENRRAAVAIAATPKRQSIRVAKEFDYRLVGIMGATDGQRTAYLQQVSSGETISVRESNLIADWTIQSIEADRILVSNGIDQRTLDLSSGG